MPNAFLFKKFKFNFIIKINQQKADEMAQKECYSLLLNVKMNLILKIGKLGDIYFPKGYYIYTGRAKKYLAKRIRRHYKKNKIKRWHIDYLTSAPGTKIQDVYIHTYPAVKECLVNQWFLGLPEAQITAPAFGASDCIHSCPSHLVFFKRKPGIKRKNEI